MRKKVAQVFLRRGDFVPAAPPPYDLTRGAPDSPLRSLGRASLSLARNSVGTAQPTIEDYAERTKEIVTAWKGMD